MSWKELRVSSDETHHLLNCGLPAYDKKFDEVLKFHEPGLAPVRIGKKAWHIDRQGQPAYERRFVRAFGFYEGLAAVVSSDGWHHIKPNGDDAYLPRYTWAGNFQGNRCTVRQPDGLYLHIDSQGEPAYGERWHYAGDFRDGIAVVQAADGRSTHIDADGRCLHGRWFIDLDVFHKGFARARDDGGWMHVNATGEPIYRRRFAAVEPFYNGQARVERFDGALEVIDEGGWTVMELRAPRRSEFAALSEDMVGFWKTQTISAAVRLGIFEVLPCSEEQVAEHCGLQVDKARRLLCALSELSLVVHRENLWAATLRGAFLKSDHRLTLADAALEYAGPLSRMWERLPDALRSDSEFFHPDIFEEVARDETRREGHHRMLRSYARHDYPSVARVLQLHGDERIIDVGGGLGTLARIVLDAYPSTQVIVLERPEVVEQGCRASQSRHGLQWHAGDFFACWELEADAVLLARILHDWDDEAAVRILKRAREALPVGGCAFIIEMLIPENGVSGALCDLHLLMVTGGRERSVVEFERLLAASGFELAEVRCTEGLPSILVGVAK